MAVFKHLFPPLQLQAQTHTNENHNQPASSSIGSKSTILEFGGQMGPL